MNPGMHLSFWICVFVLDIYLGVELLGDVVVLFLFFWETFRLFCTVAVQIYIPTNSAQSSLHPNPRVFQSGFLADAVSASPRFLPATPECSRPLPTARICTCLPEGFSRAMGFPQTYRVGWKERVGNSYPWAPSTKNWWDCVLSHSVMSDSLWPHGL